MVNEDSPSTDLSVFGEEGHSIIFLTDYIFCFCLFYRGLTYLALLVTSQNCTKMLRNRFCFVEQLSLQKATFD